jgi:hypothetical protein
MARAWSSSWIRAMDDDDLKTMMSSRMTMARRGGASLRPSGRPSLKVVK